MSYKTVLPYIVNPTAPNVPGPIFKRTPPKINLNKYGKVISFCFFWAFTLFFSFQISTSITYEIGFYWPLFISFIIAYWINKKLNIATPPESYISATVTKEEIKISINKDVYTNHLETTSLYIFTRSKPYSRAINAYHYSFGFESIKPWTKNYNDDFSGVVPLPFYFETLNKLEEYVESLEKQLGVTFKKTYTEKVIEDKKN